MDNLSTVFVTMIQVFKLAQTELNRCYRYYRRISGCFLEKLYKLLLENYVQYIVVWLETSIICYNWHIIIYLGSDFKDEYLRIIRSYCYFETVSRQLLEGLLF